MSSNRTSSTAKSTASSVILTKSNLDYHNRQLAPHARTSFTTQNDSSSDSSSDRSATPPPDFTYNRRSSFNPTSRRSPSPVRTISFTSLPATPTHQRRPVLKKPALMLEGTPVRPQRPGSVSSTSISLNRESTPSLRNTITRIDDQGPQTPREAVDHEEKVLDRTKEHDFKATPEPARFLRQDVKKLGSSSNMMMHSPVKRPIADDPEPKKIRRSESSPGRKGTEAQLSCPIIKINGQEYLQLRKVQVGGSGSVYQVLSKDKLETFAVKEINIGATGTMSMNSATCINEVELLRELQGNDCVVRLYDYEVDKVEEKLKVLFEYGEVDVEQFMKSNTLDIHDIRHFWRKMVEAVELLHERRIVHSDLKPANFIIVRGRVKIIDFGIARAIDQGTQNIHRETISGTSNFLSPEAVRNVGLVDEDNPDSELYKVGKPSDIWALGIILYHMTYGTMPFSRIKDISLKIEAIVRKKIEYPLLTKSGESVTPELLHVMKWCLKKDATKRPTAANLLAHRFLSH